MTEEQLINKIQKLRQIKPSQDWVFLTKKKILGEKTEQSWLSNLTIVRLLDFEKLIKRGLFLKPVYITLITLVVLVGVFGLVRKSVPGDTLFVIKKASERSQAVFVSEAEKPKFNLEQAKKRLEDLIKIAETNNTKKLASAISEYQEKVSEVAKDLIEEKNDEKIKEIIAEMKGLKEKEKRIESLGTVIERNIDKDYALVQTIIEHIKDLEARSLTEEQREILVEIKENIENEDFESALIKSLEINTD